eukprot:2483423-Pyramimonas_sp.AAC.1
MEIALGPEPVDAPHLEAALGERSGGSVTWAFKSASGEQESLGWVLEVDVGQCRAVVVARISRCSSREEQK